MKRRLMSFVLAAVMVISGVSYGITPVYAAKEHTADAVIETAIGYTGAPNWPNMCLAFVKWCFEVAYGIDSSSCCAYDYGTKYIDSTDRDNIPLGADVFFGGSSLSCGNCGNQCGHVGIYVGDGEIIHSWGGKVIRTTIDYVVNSGYPYRGYGWHGDLELYSGYLSQCSPITPTLAQVTGKSGNLKALPCSIETDPESFAYHSLKGKTFVVDGFCTNSAGNVWYRTSCDCGCGAEEAWVYSGDVKVDKMLYDAKITGASYPSSLKQGQFFPLEGTITTSHQIKSVTARVKTSNGKTEFSKTDSVSLKQSYTIGSVIDNAMTFNTLSAGSYVYEIEITEQTKNPATGKTESHTQVVLSKNFSVGTSNSTNSSDTLSLSGETYPTSLSVGQWFALKGTVTSSVSNITSLTAGAFDSAGNMKTGNTVSPNSKSYNIVNIDPDVHFDWLPAGTYSYIIRATNASGTKELLNKTFTVGGGSSGSGSTISTSGRYSVTNTRNITGQDIVATARQWANKGATYWSHYDPWLPSIYWRTGYTYSGQQSFDCSGFVSRVLNDCGLRSGNYTPPYGDCILSQQYGNGFMSIQIEDLVNYGTDITDAVKRAKNGDYSGLQPGDLIAWTSGSLGRHIIIYAGMKNGTPWTVEFTGNGYRDRAMPAEYQSAFQFGARLVSDAGAACSEHTKGEFLFYEGAHPHYNYYACATCGMEFTDGSSTKLSDCSACAPACTSHVKGMYSHCETEHPHYIYYYCNNCEELFKSTSTTKLDACEICTPKNTLGFSDVREGQWYYDAVQYVMENGIMSGYNSSTFGPNDTLNRAMVVQVLYNKEGQPDLNGLKHNFSDVPTNQWYNNAVAWGASRGVVSGYGGGRFGPVDSVTLEQVAVILWNYSKNPTGTGSLSGIKGQYSDWAANALRWCAGKGILNNVPYSNATEKATRAQTAQILTNFLSMPEAEAESLTLATGGSSGTWFAMGSALQNKLNSKLSQSQLAVISSGGSVDNIHKIEDGKADLAFVAADIVKDAHNGKNSFSSGKETSALWVAGLYPEAVQLVATPDITDVSQLRGKVVCVGETGSSIYNIAIRILAEYGLSTKDVTVVNGSFRDGIDGIKSGKVDAAITVAFAPTTAITELASAHDFSLVPLTGFGGDDLIPFTLPAGTYNGIDRKTDCVAVQSALVASEDVPEEVVYELLKAIFDNESALKNAYNRFKSLDVDQAALNSVSMHPGAQKYYREIGVLK